MPRSRLKGEVALARAKASERHRIGHRPCIATRKPPEMRGYDQPRTLTTGSVICRTGGKYRAARAAFGKVAQYAASAEVGEAATFAIADMDARLGRFHKARKELTAIMVRNP